VTVVTTDDADRWPAAVESAAYYVVAEALTNVVKYSGASSATIRVRNRGDALIVEIADDGRGGARASEGSGLGGLKDRVEALDGTFSVESATGSGTRIRAEFPLLPERADVPA
jgi:signal transduction histidine kinase